ncbi:MAG TPA: hypothetical protein IAB63_10805 [Candidatus Onthocola gallistercoris]|uniref:Uncharacterized protein n=1 Tax=Candidatus Onthocola gallistercoris TaxID=2840876 RepID=A0A9D1HI78_9FIRM|nr:hypothetical protein [Candidatus Onthocola gallistercoris]
MFQKFGLNDVFTGFWKFKIWLIAATLVLGCGTTAVLYWNQSRNAVDLTGKELYCSSASFYFEPSYEGDTQIIVSEDGVTAETLAVTYNVMLDADFCKQHVYDYLLEIYSEDELKKLVGKDTIDIHSFQDYFKHNILSDGRCLNIFTTCQDEAFAGNLLDAYVDYLTMVVNDQMSNTRMISLGGADQILPLSASNNDIVSGYLNDLTLVDIICVFVIVFGVLCILLFIYLLFFPTMNRASDFSYYDVNVIGEIDLNRKGD